MKFHEYPKALRGPNGEIEIAPNATKEKALRAAGYEMPGQPSAEDFARAQNHIDRDRPVAEWPKYINGKIVHDPEAPPAVPEGEFPKYVAGRVVENREDEVALLAEGDAPAMPPAGRAGERAKLMRIAAGLGLKPQVTWGVARLREAVTEAQERRTAYPMAMRGPDGGIVNARDEGEEAALLTQGYECPGTPNPRLSQKLENSRPRVNIKNGRNSSMARSCRIRTPAPNFPNGSTAVELRIKRRSWPCSPVKASCSAAGLCDAD